jgi:PKD repeat protein
VFTSVGGVAHGGLATLNPTTGARDEYMGIDVAGHHNWDGTGNTAHGSTGVENFDVTPDGSRMVVIGNFTSADGYPRDQAFRVLLGAGSATVDPDWNTDVFEPGCYTFAFDFYVRDVQFAPDGSWFAITASGGSNPGTHCDTITRWETTDSGANVQPTWTAYSGGDSSWAIAVTGVAVYLTGHTRWENNPYGNDSAGAGAVPRAGLAALDPRTGIPLAWNPGRNPRGVGGQALLATSRGLYLGSDTEFIGNRKYSRPRLAFFPLAGGSTPADETAATLPADVYLGGRSASTGSAGVDDVVDRPFDGTTPGADAAAGAGGTAWGRARGGFMVGNTLYYGFPNPDAGGAYYLYERTFDGTTWGPATALDPYNDPAWSNVSAGVNRWTGVVEYYRGEIPDFYGDQLSTVTGMFFSDGRLYYTLAGSTALNSRPFEVDSGIVGAVATGVTTTGFGDVAGMFLSGHDLYWASAATGELRRVTFTGGVPSGSAQLAAPGPAAGGRDWRGRALFLGAGGGPGDAAPTASFTPSCTGLACAFDGTASTDPDGSVASYAWDFGDGATGDGASPSHTYAAAGDYPVTLTVTDDQGATGTASQTVTVSAPATSGAIAFRGVADTAARVVTSASVTVPASVQAGDGMVLVASVNSTVSMATPSGWTAERTQASGQVVTRVFSRVATGSDAGTQVRVTLGGTGKLTLQLAAYSGTSSSDPVASVTGAADSGGTAHTTPAADAPAGAWVVSGWSDKQSGARAWSPPSGATVRSNLPGTGKGDIASLLVDSGAAAGGPVGGVTATVGTASNQATMLTIVLAAGTGPVANQPPDAAITSSCSALDCAFDGTGSTDPDGSVASYAWDFGDGHSGTGASPSHTYASAGDYTVTLTVTDDQGAAGSTTATVPVSGTPPASGIGLRASAGTSARAVTSVSVDVPDTVAPGDTLLLVLSTNSAVTGVTPTGFGQAAVQVAGTGPTTQLFTKVADAADAGSALQLSLSGRAKVTLQLLAYAGTSTTDPIASVTGASDGSGTAHTTPTASASSGSWVVSVWSDKQADARQWTAPATATERSNLAGVGSGDVATLVADSGGPVTGGQVGGLTATVPTPSNRATMLTVVLAAG